MKKRTLLFWILLAIGIACTLTMLTFRCVSELKDRNVTAAVAYDDVLELCENDGRTPTQWLADLRECGVYYLIVTDANEQAALTALADTDMSVARSGDTAKSGDAFLIPEMRDDHVFPYSEPKGDKTVPLCLVENPFRTGVVMPDGFDANNWQGSMVKTLYMFNAYSYHYQKNEPATENENILFRAVSERGMRLVILTPLVDEQKNVVTDTEAYSDLLSGLSSRIKVRGLVYGREFSAMNAPKVNGFLLAGALCLFSALATLMLVLLFSLGRKYEYILLCVLTVLFVGLSLVSAPTAQKLCSFGASVLFPCFTAFLLMKVSGSKYSIFRSSVLALLTVVALGLAGGLYIGAILGTRLYMMQFSIFAGVKISQLAPLAFTGLYLVYVFYIKKTKLERASYKKLPLGLIITMGFALVAAVVVLVLRSGDNMLPVSDVEISFRNFLEYTLYARPRTKEMLVAFPAVVLFVAAAKKQYPILQVPLGIVVTVGSASVVNTFCHIFSPVYVSVIRTLLSAGIGLLIGLAVLPLFCLIISDKKEKHNER